MVQNPAVTYPRPGFVEIELQRLDESVRCHTCGATVNEVRVMERRTSKATVSLYDCPVCGVNLWGDRGLGSDTASPTGVG
jgi:uncharacterized protein with PIN domain